MEENRKGPGVFYAVVGVATLVVAIIGATFAYFSASATDADADISGGTNDQLANALHLNVDRVWVTSDTVGKLVPADFDATREAGVNGVLAKQCKDGEYTGCHLYKITASADQAVNIANIYVTLTGPSTDKENWKYLVFKGSETAAEEITTDEATFKSTQDKISADSDITGTDIHGAALTGEVVYYLLVYLDNVNAPQNSGDTNETGTYSGTVNFYAAGGQVKASFASVEA